MYSLIETLNELIVCAGLVLLGAGILAQDWWAVWGLMLLFNAVVVEIAFLNPPERAAAHRSPRLKRTKSLDSQRARFPPRKAAA